MIANFIGVFVVILIGISLVPMISQEIDNAVNCNQTNQTNITYEQPIGSTGSFGGGGGQFGGYDGQVHKSRASNFAIYQTNETISGLCLGDNSASVVVLKLVPGFFALAILAIGIMACYNSLRDTGMA